MKINNDVSHENRGVDGEQSSGQLLRTGCIHRNADCKWWDGTDVAGTLTCNNAASNQRMPDKQKFGGVLQMCDENVEYVVRRLTPTECARLQGFPDDWGKLDGKPYSESAEYKMWGNGIALPCALYVMEGITKEMNK